MRELSGADVAQTQRLPGESAEELADRIVEMDHSQTETAWSIERALRDLEDVIAGMLLTMMPSIGPGNPGNYVISKETEEAAEGLTVKLWRDDSGRLRVTAQ